MTIKKRIILGLLLLSFKAHCQPGDDVWDSIKMLTYSLNALSTEVSQLRANLLSYQASQANTQNQVQQLLSEMNTLKALQPAKHSLGESYHGGIIFYLDETGQHGLLVSKKDCQAQGVEWRNGVAGNKVTNARADGIGAGDANTRLIIAQQTVDNQKRASFAALIAANFQVEEDGLTPCKTLQSTESLCYGNWYLPSAYELQLLYRNAYQTGFVAMEPLPYWSSTEVNVSTTWLVHFASGETLQSPKATLAGIRAISRF